MTSSLESCLSYVRKRIVPTPQERLLLTRLSRQLTDQLTQTLVENGIQAEILVQGSVAHDTWLRGEHDLDLFAIFSESVDRRDWNTRFLPAVRKAFWKYRQVERWAEHPYLELWADTDIRVNIVPCYRVERGKWKSATDRSPHHTVYMRERLTPTLRDEARLLKKFLKGIGVYGAEIRIGGFSGMLVETLTLHYSSFVDTLKGASKWTEPIFIDYEKHATAKRFSSTFAVVDPVDPERNLAASVRTENMWTFVAAAREFLTKPSVFFFEPRKPKSRNRFQFLKIIEDSRNDLVVVHFSHPLLVTDVLWGQLLSLEQTILRLAERNEFRVIRSSTWSDDSRHSGIILEVEQATLSPVQLHWGPPVFKESESGEFLRRHLENEKTISGPWIAGRRWAVERRRDAASFSLLMRKAISDGRMGLSVPKQLDKSFKRTMRVLLNREVLLLLERQGFGDALWEFLDGRPSWLMTSQ